MRITVGVEMGRKHNVFVREGDRIPQDRKLTRPGALTLVLVHPRIPQNTGAIARLCAATGSRLELVRPLFTIDDTKLKRAGLDYWPLLDVRIYDSLEDWVEKNPNIQPWIVEVGGTQRYSEAKFLEGDVLMFGDEQDGIPPSFFEKFEPSRHIDIPQINVRSLNLAMSVGIVTFEALRQIGFSPLKN
jgi:tRNA (cytidine/uridine-2'-O-)-methyltransferase